MGKTITEKILARAAQNENAKAGEIVVAKIDLAMVHDGLGPISYPQFRELGVPLWDPDKVYVFVDHAAPASTLHDAAMLAPTHEFVREHNLKNFFNVQGVAHQMIPEGGYIKPGEVAVGTDSHTCTYGALGAFATGIGSTEMCNVFATGKLWFRVPETIKVTLAGKLPNRVMSKDVILKLLTMIGANGATYKALEFCGPTIDGMSIDSRLTLCNMSIEAGAKNGIIAPDEKTIAYLVNAGVKREEIETIKSDDDANYCEEVRIDVSDLTPYIAMPHNPANGVPISEAEGIPLSQVLIGTCTNGRVEDFAIAAEIIRGHKIPNTMRCIILPASNHIFSEITRLGYTKEFIDAGCIVMNANCGPCGGMHEGLLYEGEACLGTHNRNFCGRMGSPKANIYLGSPATAAKSALMGRISDPRS